MMGCKKCSVVTGALILLLGIALLLVDLKVWTFGGIQWYTGLLLIWGVTALCKTNCPDCKACMKK